jgi:hypothetical protein
MLLSVLHIFLTSAVADLVRTSLGPKGMDKMVWMRAMCFNAVLCALLPPPRFPSAFP